MMRCISTSQKYFEYVCFTTKRMIAEYCHL